MVECLGCCIPHHVQMFFRQAHDLCLRRNQRQVSQADAEHIYRNEMLSIRGHTELAHYEERLQMVLGDEIWPLALEMLTETAVVGQLTSEAMHAVAATYDFASLSIHEVQKQILDVLEHDGYLTRRLDHYEFVSKLLRDWWQARHGFGYIPTLQRGA